MDITPDELRKRIPQWSLKSDGQLLQYMVQISKNLEEKCKQTQDNLNRLLMQGEECHLRFANASNNFNGVQQSKFVENRVEDDDESFYSVREEVEEPGERLPHGEIFMMAVERSIEGMYRCFEKVTVEVDSDSDSDDEEEAAARNTVLRAVQKYPYIHRPLGHIIGSVEWREKWHVGLVDSEEESDTETKEQYSDSSDSERLMPSRTESNNTPTESEGSVWGIHSDPKRRGASMDQSMSDDAISIHSSSSSIRPPAGMRAMVGQQKVPVLPGSSFRPPSLFPDRPPDDAVSISSRSKVPNLFEESDEDESTPVHKPVVVPVTSVQKPSYFRGNQPERKTVNLFSDEPPPTSNFHPTSSAESSNIQTRKPVNLFIDSDDEDNMFNNNPTPKAGSVYQNEPPELKAKQNANLFDKRDSSQKSAKVFDKENNNPVSSMIDEEDIFVPAQRSVNDSETRKQASARRITNLFDDEPPEDDFDELFKPKSLTNKKIPGAKLVLPVSVAVSRKDEPKEETPKIVEPTVKPRKVNLFDEDDDDINDKLVKSTTEARVQEISKRESEATKSPAAVTKKSVNLFDDDDNNQDDLYTNILSKKDNPITASKPKINLFDDEQEDIFVPSTSNPVNPVLEQSSAIAVAPKSKELKEPSEIIEPPSQQNVQESTKLSHTSIRSEILKKKSIFDSDSNDDDDEGSLFGNNSPIKVVKFEPEALPRSSKIEHANKPEATKSSIENIEQELNKANNQRNDNFKFKPKIPDLPPIIDQSNNVKFEPQVSDESLEIDPWEETPPDDDNFTSYPHVSNDIEYFLTTNEVSGPQVEPTPIITPNSIAQPGINDAKIESKLNPKSDVAISDEKESLPKPNKSALNFSSIGLFSDLPPPDDDFQDFVGPTLSTDPDEEGIFASKTLQSRENASAITAAANANGYLFMDDEPPPDEGAASFSTGKDEVDDLKVSQKEKIEPPISTSSVSNFSSDFNAEKSRINRLSARVNINVNALLPGAIRPQSVSTRANESTQVSVPKATPVTSIVTIGTERLTGLNKNRAKIQAKRKPSSRQQRRANYENSLSISTKGIPETPSVVNPSLPNTVLENPNEEIRVVVGSEVKIHHVEVTAAHLTVEQALTDELSQKQSEPKLYDNSDEDIETKSQTVTFHTTLPKILSDEFNPVNAKPTKLPSKTRTMQKSSKLFSDEDSDDDLFGSKSVQPSKTIDPPKPTSNPLSSAKPRSIFDDSDDDDDLFSTKSKPASAALRTSSNIVTKSTASTVSNPVQKKTNQQSSKSIFGSEGDSDGEDLFGGAAKKSAKPLATVSTERASVGQGTVGLKTADAVKSIFSDDDDDDDLFGGTKTKPAPKPNSSHKPDSNAASIHSKSPPDDPLTQLLGGS